MHEWRCATHNGSGFGRDGCPLCDEPARSITVVGPGKSRDPNIHAAAAFPRVLSPEEVERLSTFFEVPIAGPFESVTFGAR